MGREQEADAEEKNRHSRVQGASLPACLPAFLQMEKPKAAELCWAQYLLASRRKAKEIWILIFFLPLSFPSAYSPGLCGFPGAELKAAVQKHMASIERRTDTALSACANLEPCWVNPGSHHLKFMVFSFLSS